MARRLPLGAFILLAVFIAIPSFAVPAVGVSGTNLVRFDTATPGAITSTLPITGVTGTIVGIDFRPATSTVVALSSNSNLYTINIQTGAATLVGTVPTALSGTAFGTDFNPTVDRLRVVSDADQNIRIVPDTAALAATDTPLQYAVGDTNAAQNPNVTAVAYTNNVAGALTTTLYGIDTNLDILVIQNPPNSGTLNTVGSLGFDTSAVTGFDIEGGTGNAFAALTVGGISQLYSINLTTGAATLIGPIGSGTLSAFTTVPAGVALGSAVPALSMKMLALLALALVAVAAFVLKS